jgi:hypothetical protein
LKRNNHHENLLLPLLQKWLEERPSSTDQYNDGEKQHDTDELENVEKNIPTVWSSGDLDIVFIFGGANEIKSFHEEKSRHEKMDPVNGAFVVVTDIEPDTEKTEVNNGEEEKQSRKLSLTGGEIITGFIGIKVEKLGANRHGNGSFRRTISKEETELIRIGNRIRTVKRRRWRW